MGARDILTHRIYHLNTAGVTAGTLFQLKRVNLRGQKFLDGCFSGVAADETNGYPRIKESATGAFSGEELTTTIARNSDAAQPNTYPFKFQLTGLTYVRVEFKSQLASGTGTLTANVEARPS